MTDTLATLLSGDPLVEAVYVNGSPIEVGDYVVVTAGAPEDRDCGRVIEVGDTVTIHWLGSESRTDEPIATVAGWEAYIDRESALLVLRDLDPVRWSH